MSTIRAGKGLGDSLYLQGVVRHMIEQGRGVTPCSNWPEVFGQLPVKVIPFTRQGVDICAHYTTRKAYQGTSQWQDCCINAGLGADVDFRIDWKPTSVSLKRDDRPLILISLPRLPMGREDGFGRSLLPDCSVIQRCIDRIKPHVRIVQVGAGEPLYRFRGIDDDLANRTSITDLLNVSSLADGFLGYCSWLVPLAESFNRPALFVWSRKGLHDRHAFIRQIIPGKVLHRSSSGHVFDDAGNIAVDDAADSFLRQVHSSRSDRW